MQKGKAAKQGGHWTEEEHQLFLKGIELYGNQWKKVTELVKTRTHEQVRSHNQKYQQKLAMNKQKAQSDQQVETYYQIKQKVLNDIKEVQKEDEPKEEQQTPEDLMKQFWNEIGNIDLAATEQIMRKKIQERKDMQKVETMAAQEQYPVQDNESSMGINLGSIPSWDKQCEITKQKSEDFDTVSLDLKENLMLDCLKDDDSMLGNPLNQLDDVTSKISSQELEAESSGLNQFDNVFNMSTGDNFLENPMMSFNPVPTFGRPKKLVKHARHYYRTFEYQCDDRLVNENLQEDHSIKPFSTLAPIVERSDSPLSHLSFEKVKKRDAKALAKAQLQPELDQEEQNEVTVTELEEVNEMTQTQATSPEKKRRGRKRERDDLYCVKAEEKIQDIKKKLLTAKADGIPVKQRQRLRNQISAQQSRIKKKQESIFLNNSVRSKDLKFKKFVKAVSEMLDKDQMAKLVGKVDKLWESDELDAEDQMQPSLKIQKRSKSDKENDQKVTLSNAILNNFITKEEELDQFKQNDEKIYDDED